MPPFDLREGNCISDIAGITGLTGLSAIDSCNDLSRNDQQMDNAQKTLENMHKVLEKLDQSSNQQLRTIEETIKPSILESKPKQKFIKLINSKKKIETARRSRIQQLDATKPGTSGNLRSLEVDSETSPRKKPSIAPETNKSVRTSQVLASLVN